MFLLQNLCDVLVERVVTGAGEGDSEHEKKLVELFGDDRARGSKKLFAQESDALRKFLPR